MTTLQLYWHIVHNTHTKLASILAAHRSATIQWRICGISVRSGARWEFRRARKRHGDHSMRSTMSTGVSLLYQRFHFFFRVGSANIYIYTCTRCLCSSHSHTWLLCGGTVYSCGSGFIYIDKLMLWKWGSGRTERSQHTTLPSSAFCVCLYLYIVLYYFYR